MTCTTCGRENPPHLTFCQECGQRLGPRIAPPTPPIGLGVEAGGQGNADFYAQPPSRLATSLGSGGPSPVSAAAQAQAQQAQGQPQQVQPQQGGERRCRICATPNGPTLRYCTSCGSTLDGPVQPVGAAPAPAPGPAPRLVEAAPVAPPPVHAAPIAPAPAPFAATALASPNASPAIAPMRVVDLGSAARAADGPRMCGRCRGVVDTNAQFCKFCGAPLGADAAAPPPRAEPPPAPVAPAPIAAANAAPALAPPQPHERLDLPGASNGYGAPPAPAPMARAPTAPMNTQDNPPTPFAAFPANPGAATVPPLSHAESQAQAPAPARAPAPPAQPAPQAAPQPAPQPPVARAVTRGRLVVIAKSGADGPSYPIGDTLDVGRTEGQIIVGEDPYLSPRHVRIAWTGTKLVLRDLASTNGVFIRLVAAREMNPTKAGGKGAANDDKVPGEVAVPLQDQDLILVGQQVLRFDVINSGSGGEAGLGPATEHGTLLFGSPAAPRYARLSQRTVEGVTRDVYYVRKVETVLGRESGDVVFTEDPFLSRRHAAVRVLGLEASPRAALPAGAKAPPAARTDSLQFALVDLGSSNGSFLRIRNEIDLVPGDHFRVGQQLFRVDFDTAGRAG